MRRLLPGLLAISTVAALTSLGAAQSPPHYPLAEIRPGMVGIGRTVYSGTALEEFRAEIIGVLHNVIGPDRNLILARLSGGPLASTGVIQGMSGSPVYIDGRLIGAVSYSLGSFPKEPIAAITPIAEMIDAVDRPAPEPRRADAGREWPQTMDGVAVRLSEVIEAAAPRVGLRLPASMVARLPALADLSPTLRPIGAAMVVSGLSPRVAAALGHTRPSVEPEGQASDTRNGPADVPPLRPGDPVGMSLVRGDLELGATGTVTHVDGARVYAFGHPFLNLGPTSMAMTRAHVFTVLPSLDTSMKIAGLGPVIGTVGQDRATAIGGTLGTLPAELQVDVTLTTPHQPARQFSFAVLHDEGLTPLFAFVTIFNTIVGYERNSGPLSIVARGSVDYGPHGQIEIDDVFTGPTAIGAVSAAATASMGPAASNRFASVLPTRLTLDLHVAEETDLWTIERAWLDTTRPRFGGTHTVHVSLRHYRGGEQTVAVPVTMPERASGPLTLLVGAAPAIEAVERDWRSAQPASLDALFRHLAEVRPNNRLYVRLIEPGAGTVMAGSALPGLPGSVRSVLESDPTTTAKSVTRTLVGAWEHRLTGAVAGSHELTLTLSSAR
ncbi:MAG TPA: SpoIVB peptidase S55 domain-containing protein [Vicinamibacterales bacterium]|nr:SpoIVB peptidase S55 domain-containing protein [Vicinamibacterales bacterium]